ARADLAMYLVKRRGGADVLLHTAALQPEGVEDLALGRALARALVDEQVTVSFQPIIDLPTGRLDTLEALARWAPGGRPVAPETFVRVAESCDLIDSLFRFVLEEACTQLTRWRTLPGGSDVRVAVNITPRQLASPELPGFIAAELTHFGLSGDRLVLEIIETGMLTDTATTHTVCHELRRLGVRLSVDDFGTGPSSLARLRDLPINEVKIDRSFISNLDQDEARRRFVWGVVAFAERVGLTVVAEGVEKQAELDALTALGCHRIQGFLFSRPLPAEAVDTLLRHPGSWVLGIPASPPEPPGSGVRQRPRSQPDQFPDTDAPPVPEPLT
ncbi:MAG TPA: EAL domain-containing protein, partial [Dermatophilaceae bacterium]